MATGSATNSLYNSIFGALRTLLHLTAAVQFTYGIYYDYAFVEFPKSSESNPKLIYHPFGGKFKYLTFLDAVSGPNGIICGARCTILYYIVLHQ